ncbi:MAG: hypothetical protein Q9Q40_03855 [Acidobacteriota bacterium]|nr:hypothetical protein [Acidobacteriota bacterium]MDQ7088640.1 hypothetical protein [Acidobacteriota bacterium]
MSWSGVLFAALWVEARGGQWNVYHAEVDEAGTPTRLPRLVQSATEPVSDVDPAWIEDRQGATWNQ